MAATADPVLGANNTFYVPYPILALASNGGDIFCTAGGGGSTSVKEVPNQVHAHQYCEASNKLSTIAALNTGKNLVVAISYSHVTKLWLASSRRGTKILSLSGRSLTELCEFLTEEDGKEPEQNFAFYSPDAALIATGGTDGMVKVWNAGSPGSVPTFQRNCGTKTKEILDAAFSPDSRYLAACDGTGNCRLWELSQQLPEDGTLVSYNSKAVKGKALIKAVRFISHKDKPTLMFAANGTQRKMAFGVVGLFSMQGEQLVELVVDKGPLKSLSVTIDEKLFVVGLMAGKKVVCKLPDFKCMQKTKELHSLPAQCVAWTGESTAISVSGDRDIHLLRVNVGGSAYGFLISVMLVLILVVYQLYRIGMMGGFLGQGRTDL